MPQLKKKWLQRKDKQPETHNFIFGKNNSNHCLTLCRAQAEPLEQMDSFTFQNNHRRLRLWGPPPPLYR